MPFQKLGLPSSLLANLTTLGYQQPTPIQAQAIPMVRSRRDLVATAQTGTGKTAAFLLPLLEQLLEQPRRETSTLILVPTRELAQQIHTVFRGLTVGTPLKSAVVIGGFPLPPQVQALRRQPDVVIATPGRLLAILREGWITLPSIATLVLDEADQMFDLGFFPDIKRIVQRLPAARQTLLFSATMPPEVAKLGRTILRDPATVAVGPPGQVASKVAHTAYPVPASRKTALLEHLLDRMDDPSVLIFTRTRRGAKRLARTLERSGQSVGQLHSDCTPRQRERAMQGFRDRQFPILVATNIAARGLDVRHITHVINYDVPAAPEEYVHRIGRTGRAGDTGDALVLVSPEEQDQLRRIERQLGKAIPRQRLTDFDYESREPVKPAGPRRREASGPIATQRPKPRLSRSR